MNIKTNLLEDDANFVDALLSKHVDFVVTTKKQSTHFKIFIVLFVIILSLFLVLFQYLNE